MSFTYKPKKKKRNKTHGFLKRSSSKSGKKIIKRRKAKGRKKVTV
ncbi:MAG: 50S ribosomal protein L34 [Candidatus Pacebacteria bacterium]|nr:50S ribosomal protein L34 [Candidatus Paceibacterota bacterium]